MATSTSRTRKKTSAAGDAAFESVMNEVAVGHALQARVPAPRRRRAAPLRPPASRG